MSTIDGKDTDACFKVIEEVTARNKQEQLYFFCGLGRSLVVIWNGMPAHQKGSFKKKAQKATGFSKSMVNELVQLGELVLECPLIQFANEKIIKRSALLKRAKQLKSTMPLGDKKNWQPPSSSAAGGGGGGGGL